MRALKKRFKAVEGRGFAGALGFVVGVDKSLNGKDARVAVGDAETEGSGEGGGRGGRVESDVDEVECGR